MADVFQHERSFPAKSVGTHSRRSDFVWAGCASDLPGGRKTSCCPNSVEETMTAYIFPTGSTTPTDQFPVHFAYPDVWYRDFTGPASGVRYRVTMACRNGHWSSEVLISCPGPGPVTTTCCTDPTDPVLACHIHFIAGSGPPGFESDVDLTLFYDPGVGGWVGIVLDGGVDWTVTLKCVGTGWQVTVAGGTCSFTGAPGTVDCWPTSFTLTGTTSGTSCVVGGHFVTGADFTITGTGGGGGGGGTTCTLIGTADCGPPVIASWSDVACACFGTNIDVVIQEGDTLQGTGSGDPRRTMGKDLGVTLANADGVVRPVYVGAECLQFSNIPGCPEKAETPCCPFLGIPLDLRGRFVAPGIPGLDGVENDWVRQPIGDGEWHINDGRGLNTTPWAGQWEQPLGTFHDSIAFMRFSCYAGPPLVWPMFNFHFGGNCTFFQPATGDTHQQSVCFSCSPLVMVWDFVIQQAGGSTTTCPYVGQTGRLVIAESDWWAGLTPATVEAYLMSLCGPSGFGPSGSGSGSGTDLPVAQPPTIVGRSFANRTRPVEYATGTWSGSGSGFGSGSGPPDALTREVWYGTCCTGPPDLCTGSGSGSGSGGSGHVNLPDFIPGGLLCCPDVDGHPFTLPGTIYAQFIEAPITEGGPLNIRRCAWLPSPFTVACDVDHPVATSTEPWIGWVGHYISQRHTTPPPAGFPDTCPYSICEVRVRVLRDPSLAPGLVDGYHHCGWWEVDVICRCPEDYPRSFFSCQLAVAAPYSQIVCKYHKFLCRRPLYETIGICPNGAFVDVGNTNGNSPCGINAPNPPPPPLDCGGLTTANADWPGYELQVGRIDFNHPPNPPICCPEVETVPFWVANWLTGGWGVVLFEGVP